MVRADENKIIYKNKLIAVFKRFRNYPNKVFVASDFFMARTNLFRKKYLNTLISLGLIEQVTAIYKSGRNLNVRRQVKGYKLI